MKGNALIGLLIIAGAGGLVYFWYRSRVNADSTGRTIPQPSGFDYSASITPPARTRPPDAPIIGYAVPRTSTTTTTAGSRGATSTGTGTATPIATSGAGAYAVPDFQDTEEPIFMEAL